MGSGLPTLGSGQLRDSDEVTEAQLQLLIGMGRDPLTGAPLGGAHPAYKSVTRRVEKRVGTLDSELEADRSGPRNLSVAHDEQWPDMTSPFPSRNLPPCYG